MRRSPLRTPLARLRIARKVSQKELAALLGVHPVYLGEVERGVETSRSLCARGMALLRGMQVNGA